MNLCTADNVDILILRHLQCLFCTLKLKYGSPPWGQNEWCLSAWKFSRWTSDSKNDFDIFKSSSLSIEKISSKFLWISKLGKNIKSESFCSNFIKFIWNQNFWTNILCNNHHLSEFKFSLLRKIFRIYQNTCQDRMTFCLSFLLWPQ